ncbi:hypothetical protein [Alkalihalobacterium bogoriense]|uniref:hypothetical protein n=1 Tax=Alkalihalobacterium bogoriense TaxID=246272 RepID=UPI00047BA11B|nr:hypothetical protein [Alkalihalobacterium bogoriense]
MLVAAIVIPILFTIFLFIVKKDKKKYRCEWENVGTIKEVSSLRGKIIKQLSEKKRYYQHLYTRKIRLTIETKEGVQYEVIFEKPIKDGQDYSFPVGTIIHAHGQWVETLLFHANRIEKRDVVERLN